MVRRRGLAGRAALLSAVAVALLLGAHSGAAAHEGDEEPLPVDTGDDLRPVYEIPAGADRIIGSPDPGPDPQHSGDRGGSLQFVTLGAVAAAVAFIMWRITRAARRSSRHASVGSRG
ncbi:MAG: hypothetical protein OXC00_02985 [Acidimicrobiaceae bacterium]|nr:hypothetical protein [Acidimicrobiaceae bacterium]